MQSNTAEKLEVYEVPAGGIGDFVMSDEHLEHFEKEDAKKILGSKGIASYEKIAANMASMGRFGDDSVAHLETGEIIVPRALVERNPELKESIFKNLREAGIDNPERYVVGSSQNSINPDTGLPEFFLKKLVRGIKKVFKAVKKVAKVVVPIIASVLLTPIVGPVAAGAITGGISTLAQGGNLKNAIVLKGNEILNDEKLRNSKEFVNHKILDCLGDIYLAGYRMVGKITSSQGGHNVTNQGLRELFKNNDNFTIVELKEKNIPHSFLVKNTLKYIA